MWPSCSFTFKKSAYWRKLGRKSGDMITDLLAMEPNKTEYLANPSITTHIHMYWFAQIMLLNTPSFNTHICECSTGTVEPHMRMIAGTSTDWTELKHPLYSCIYKHVQVSASTRNLAWTLELWFSASQQRANTLKTDAKWVGARFQGSGLDSGGSEVYFQINMCFPLP